MKYFLNKLDKLFKLMESFFQAMQRKILYNNQILRKKIMEFIGKKN